jgi:hypothetical protein
MPDAVDEVKAKGSQPGEQQHARRPRGEQRHGPLVLGFARRCTGEPINQHAQRDGQAHAGETMHDRQRHGVHEAVDGQMRRQWSL